MAKKDLKLHTVLLDDRSQEDKQKDYDSRELVSSAIPTYTTRVKAIKMIGKYPTKNQGPKNSCAANTGALCLGIHETLEGRPYIELSDDFIYWHRMNKGTNNPKGMFVYNLGEIGKNKGSCKFATLPSTKTDDQIDALKITTQAYEEALQFRGLNYFLIQTSNIDDYVQIANDSKLPVGIFVWGTVKEWSMEFPEILDDTLTLDNAPVRHLVTILPGSGYIYRKKRYVIIQDSSHFGKKTHRHVSEDWFKKRVVCGIYWTLLDLDKPLDIPTFKLTRDLSWGMEGKDVVNLQSMLKYLGFFDGNCTGYFGGLTYQSVIKYQNSRSSAILSVLGLSQATGIVGPSTRRQLKKEFE